MFGVLRHKEVFIPYRIPTQDWGYIQPVSSEQSDHLKKLDRRRVGNGKTAKGIFDNSWDRWLEQYQNNIYSKRPTKKLSKKFRKKFSHMNNTKTPPTRGR